MVVVWARFGCDPARQCSYGMMAGAVVEDCWRIDEQSCINHEGGRGVKLKGKLFGSTNIFFHHMSLSSMHVLRHNLLGGLLSLLGELRTHDAVTRVPHHSESSSM